MGFIGKIFLGIVWLVVALTMIEGKGVSAAQGMSLIGAGWAVILFWGVIKKIVSDRYEDGRAHNNRRKQIDLELHAMERRINATISEQRAGHDRTMQLMQFRQQLLQMEAQENDAMVRAMISTLDSVK